MRSLWLLITSAICVITCSAQSCSTSKLCSTGCCSKAGKCGFGPDFCDKGCQSTCDAKSECDPGWGLHYSSASKCPLNACCRVCPHIDRHMYMLTISSVSYRLQYHRLIYLMIFSNQGSCGSNADFCGPNSDVKAPVCKGLSASKRTVGYYEGWSLDRSVPYFLIFP